MSACAAPVGHERLVAYWANELDDAEVAAIDDHLFGCETCSAEAQGVSNIVQAFRTSVPPVVTREQVESMRAQGRVVVENEFRAGVPKTAVFERGVDLLIHRLGGLDLWDAERVDVVVINSTGPIVQDSYVPFDAERGEVMIACERHIATYLIENVGANVSFDVHVHRPGAPPTVATFLIPHAIAA